MNKIYGYKTEDVALLAQYIKNRGNASLTSIFNEYASNHGKAKGTVRNLYYALAKKSVEDGEFCQKYLAGEPIKVSKIVEFDEKEERQLIKSILLAQNKGKSVRSFIMELSNGHSKTALRYQNKYRNAIKNKPQLLQSIIKELEQENEGFCANNINKTLSNRKENDEKIQRLKHDIDLLVEKIAIDIRKENQLLKERVVSLEKENLRLLKLVYGNSGRNFLLPHIHNGGQSDTIS